MLNRKENAAIARAKKAFQNWPEDLIVCISGGELIITKMGCVQEVWEKIPLDISAEVVA
jgi:hypothetical protein